MDAPLRKYSKTELVLKDGLLVMRVPYERVRVEAVKTIPGCTFRADLGGWAAPLGSIRESLEWCKQFAVPIPQAAYVVLRHVEHLERSMIALSSKKDGVRVEVPGLQGELMEHQHVAVKYATIARRAFIADDVGVGKTLSAIASLEVGHSPEKPSYPALVVCPPKLALNWQIEYERFLPHRKTQVLSTKAEAPDPEAEVVIVGHSLLAAKTKKGELIGGRWRSVVVDESHSFKTPTAQRTKALKQIVKGTFNRSTKEWEGGVPEDAMLLALTGTPITIRPADYVPQLEIIRRLDDFGGDMGFYRTFCDAKKDAHQKWDFTGSSNLELLNAQLRMTCYVRRERMDVIPDLLPAVHSDLTVPLEEKWMAEYQKAEADVVEYLVQRARELAAQLGADVRSAAVSARMRAEAGEHLVRVSVLRRLAAMGKLPYAVEWVQERLDEGRRVLVAAHHRDVVDAIAAEFGDLKIQGGMTAAQTEAVKKKFQSGAAPVLSLSIQAGKEGHTLTAASDVLFLEFPWTSTDFDQVWGRAHRNGQKGTVFVTSLLGYGTLDTGHFDMLGRRRQMVSVATSGAADASEAVVLGLLERGLDAAKPPQV